MRRVAWQNAGNIDIKAGIPHTQIFWQLIRQSSLMQLIPWKRTIGSARWSPSSSYFTVRSFRKLCMLRNNFKAQLEPGGLPTLPPYLLITTSHRASSTLPFVLTTCVRVCSAAS
jgi:hypothetical protein